MSNATTTDTVKFPASADLTHEQVQTVDEIRARTDSMTVLLSRMVLDINEADWVRVGDEDLWTIEALIENEAQVLAEGTIPAHLLTRDEWGLWYRLTGFGHTRFHVIPRCHHCGKNDVDDSDAQCPSCGRYPADR